MVYSVTGEQKTWHKIVLDFKSDTVFVEEGNTFRDYRLDVTFTHEETGETLTVPGYFAADGDAANSSATSGNIWRVNFNPPLAGEWSYEVSFRTGNDIAAKPNMIGQAAGAIDGETGALTVTETDKTGEDFRAKGMIVQDEGTHFLQYQGDGDYFVRGGPGVPENFLADSDIDNTEVGRHDYENHISDYNTGDPTWQNGKGKGLIGAINYVAEQGLNTLYFIANTAGGDGKDVWPWAATDLDVVKKNESGLTSAEIETYSTYDVSKLAQWEILFDHMDEIGIYKNFLFQETENDQLLNGGTSLAWTSLSVERLVYMREMIARFGHNNGIQWNLGEENTNTTEERTDMSDYVEALDPYGHLVVAHSYPGQINEVFDPMLGVDSFDGTSFQVSANGIRNRTIEFSAASEEAGDPWVLAWDEDSSLNSVVDAYEGDPDSDNEQTLRKGLWGHLTAGGSGVNWYLRATEGHGYDQNVDDYKGFTSLWTWTAAAVSFFNDEIPFWEMTQWDGLTPSEQDYVLADPGEVYTIYRPYGTAGDVSLRLGGYDGVEFEVSWYNPRQGGALISGGTVTGGSMVSLSGAPSETGKDWVVLVRRADDGTTTPDTDDADKDDGDDTSVAAITLSSYTVTLNEAGDMIGEVSVEASEETKFVYTVDDDRFIVNTPWNDPVLRLKSGARLTEADGDELIITLTADDNGTIFSQDITLEIVDDAADDPDFSLMFSSFADRSSAHELSGATLSGDVFIFTTGTEEVERVVFSYDGKIVYTDEQPIHDYQGTAADGTATAWDTSELGDGLHELSARVHLSNGEVHAIDESFEIDNGNEVPTVGAPFATDGKSLTLNGATLYGIGIDGSSADVVYNNGKYGVADIGLDADIDYKNGAEAIGIDFNKSAEAIEIALKGLFSNAGVEEAAKLTFYSTEGEVVQTEIFYDNTVETVKLDEAARYAVLSAMPWQDTLDTGILPIVSSPDFFLEDLVIL